jgi:hypothetical protein
LSSLIYLLLSGFEKAQRLLLVGGGCLLIVFLFGIILCRLDISAGKSKKIFFVISFYFTFFLIIERRANAFQQVEH